MRSDSQPEPKQEESEGKLTLNPETLADLEVDDATAADVEGGRPAGGGGDTAQSEATAGSCTACGCQQSI
jgi:hypothetical protein